MITVSVKNLVEAIQEADAFKMPEMNEGTAYLYDTIYNNLSRDMDVKLSDIDFDAFEAEDIGCLNDLHSDVLEKNYCAGTGYVNIHITCAGAISSGKRDDPVNQNHF